MQWIGWNLNCSPRCLISQKNKGSRNSQYCLGSQDSQDSQDNQGQDSLDSQDSQGQGSLDSQDNKCKAISLRSNWWNLLEMAKATLRLWIIFTLYSVKEDLANLMALSPISTLILKDSNASIPITKPQPFRVIQASISYFKSQTKPVLVEYQSSRWQWLTSLLKSLSTIKTIRKFWACQMGRSKSKEKWYRRLSHRTRNSLEWIV